ncbi:hypothetical protein GXM_05246 [Nostoc sphaeroides CCNUC1]|uniref:Uncharacterized protein n=1 Tax=Nostoc sphaeroides CCNUC1 TaxID=2653204 RepID=A0A5P8W534_9NOSO|nr:hypothetical protein GXM_05246 [Nostoc sphaeroides CCNUC1]
MINILLIVSYKGTAMLIGVNLSKNSFKTSFPARGWKCYS